MLLVYLFTLLYFDLLLLKIDIDDLEDNKLDENNLDDYDNVDDDNNVDDIIFICLLWYWYKKLILLTYLLIMNNYNLLKKNIYIIRIYLWYDKYVCYVFLL